MNTIKDAQNWINDADGIIITAGNGFAQNEGLDMLDEASFKKNFPEIVQKYHAKTIADALDKKFDSWNEQWQFWSDLIKKYSLDYNPSKAMIALLELVKDKEYFVATSTYGNFFERADFDKERIFNIFGNWTKMQCSSGQNHGTFSDIEVVKNYVAGNGQVPLCEDCNSEMELHMPLNAHFFPDTESNSRFRWFLTNNENKKIVVLELGVDPTSPQLLDPMASLVSQFKDWKYIAADFKQADLPENIKNKSVGLNMPINELITEMKG